jgi:hypothetical protein
MHGPVLLLLIRNAVEGRESVARIEAMHTLRRRAGAAASMVARERTAVRLVFLGYWCDAAPLQVRLHWLSNAGTREPSHRPNPFR